MVSGSQEGVMGVKTIGAREVARQLSAGCLRSDFPQLLTRLLFLVLFCPCFRETLPQLSLGTNQSAVSPLFMSQATPRQDLTMHPRTYRKVSATD